MRRIVAVLAVVGVAGPLLGFALLHGLGSCNLHRAGFAVLETMAPVARAQSTLEFKPVPPESASALEFERTARRAKAAASAARPAAPAQPAVAESSISVPAIPAPSAAPEPPEPPSTVGDITRMGSDITVAENEVVRGDVTAFGGDVTVDGTVHGAVVAMGGDVHLGATARVDGDVVCIGGQLHEDPGAYVSGERVTALGGRHGKRILRDIRLSQEQHRQFDFAWNFLRVVGAVARFLVTLGLAWLIVWLFAGRVRAAADTLKAQPGLSLGIGGLVIALAIPSIIALALVVALLCITIIGIPLALAALLGYGLFFVVFVLFGAVVGAVVVGERVLANRGQAAPTLVAAALTGTAIVAGARLLGRLLHTADFVGIGGLGTLLVVLAWIAAAFLSVIGGGAWLRWEFTSGLLKRWWNRRGNGTFAAPAPPPPAAPGAPAVVSAPPPEAYMPPPTPPPPDPAEPTTGS